MEWMALERIKMFNACGVFFCVWEFYKINHLSYYLHIRELIQRQDAEYQKNLNIIFQIAFVELFYFIWVIYGFFTPFRIQSFIILLFLITKFKISKIHGNFIHYLDSILTILLIISWIIKDVN